MRKITQCRFCAQCGDPLDPDSGLYCLGCNEKRKNAIAETKRRISGLDLSDFETPKTFTREEELAYVYGKAARAALPERYWKGFDWPGYEKYGGRVKKGREWASGFKKGGRGLYINGAVGCGKTGLACSIAIEVGRRGYRVGFQNVLEIPQDIKETWNQYDRSENDFWRDLLAYDLLIIDELGDETSDENTRSLYQLFDRAARDLSPTFIITSNRLLASLREVYGPGNGERLVSRIGQMTEYFGTFPLEDLRAK